MTARAGVVGKRTRVLIADRNVSRAKALAAVFEELQSDVTLVHDARDLSETTNPKRNRQQAKRFQIALVDAAFCDDFEVVPSDGQDGETRRVWRRDSTHGGLSAVAAAAGPVARQAPAPPGGAAGCGEQREDVMLDNFVRSLRSMNGNGTLHVFGLATDDVMVELCYEAGTDHVMEQPPSRSTVKSIFNEIKDLLACEDGSNSDSSSATAAFSSDNESNAISGGQSRTPLFSSSSSSSLGGGEAMKRTNTATSGLKLLRSERSRAFTPGSGGTGGATSESDVSYRNNIALRTIGQKNSGGAVDDDGGGDTSSSFDIKAYLDKVGMMMRNGRCILPRPNTFFFFFFTSRRRRRSIVRIQARRLPSLSLVLPQRVLVSFDVIQSLHILASRSPLRQCARQGNVPATLDVSLAQDPRGCGHAADAGGRG